MRRTPPPASARSRPCARASWDLEKLVVLPIMPAISSWVYPSTSCSHTTARETSGQPLERRLEIHPEVVILADPAHDVVMQLVGVPILVAAEPHERLARRDGPDPAPQAAVLAVLPDAPADLQEGLLEHVLGVLGGSADAAAEIVDGGFERAVQGLEAGGVARLGLGNHTPGVGEQERIHGEGSRHGRRKDAGGGPRVATDAHLLIRSSG